MHYIMENPASAPAYFALFQTVNGSLIFNPISNPDDIKFVGAVATAWDANYPGTSRTENLHNIAIQGMKNTKRPTPVSLEDIDPGKISAAGIIDIELPDIHGKTASFPTSETRSYCWTSQPTPFLLHKNVSCR